MSFFTWLLRRERGAPVHACDAKSRTRVPFAQLLVRFRLWSRIRRGRCCSQVRRQRTSGVCIPVLVLDCFPLSVELLDACGRLEGWEEHAVKFSFRHCFGSSLFGAAWGSQPWISTASQSSPYRSSVCLVHAEFQRWTSVRRAKIAVPTSKSTLEPERPQPRR